MRLFEVRKQRLVFLDKVPPDRYCRFHIKRPVDHRCSATFTVCCPEFWWARIIRSSSSEASSVPTPDLSGSVLDAYGLIKTFQITLDECLIKVCWLYFRELLSLCESL